MGISNLFLPFFWLCITGLFANGDIADMTDYTPPPPPAAAADSVTAQLKPGIVVTVGILTTIFSITFLLLLFVKHCRPGGYSYSLNEHRPAAAAPRNDPGVNRKVIQSLPIFRFSSLRGQKEGLECAVCLNKFEPEEVMKLLPKCKHAFHVECVDVWLEIHPTCPLCRYRVHPEDVLLLDGKSLYNHTPTPRGSDNGRGDRESGGNARVSGRHTSAGECLEIIVENPADDNNNNNATRERRSLDSWSSRRNKTGGAAGNRKRDFRCRSLDSWRARRSSGDHSGEIPGRRSRSLSRKDGRLPVQGDKHRLEHQIILSGGEGEGEGEGVRRWSDAGAADMLYLRTEMIIGGEGESGRGVINGRSVSELTGVSRYNNRGNSNNGGGRREERERRQGEGVMRRWLSSISMSNTAVNNSAHSNVV